MKGRKMEGEGDVRAVFYEQGIPPEQRTGWKWVFPFAFCLLPSFKKRYTNEPSASKIKDSRLRLGAMRIFVLLFNVGTDDEGLHTLQIGDRNIILMFEEEDDATRYALLLEAQDFPVPTVETIDQEEIEDFCDSAGYTAQLVPKGFVPQSDADRLLLAPPETNLTETDWQQDKQQNRRAASEDAPSMPESELEKIRRRLEGLL
jgi:Protein of unknown function (DUF3110)